MSQSPQYRTLQQLDLSRDDLRAWADSRKTDEVVALAIHAIADSSRSPEAIWEAPTPQEWQQVAMAVENYTDCGLYVAEGIYHWGEEKLHVGAAAGMIAAARSFIVINDGQVCFPVGRAEAEQSGATEESVRAMDEDEYAEWCRQMPVYDSGQPGSESCINLCRMLVAGGADEWHVAR